MNSPLYTRYKSIEDDRVRNFLSQAFEDAVSWYGEPRIPVNTVHIRLSEPKRTTDNIRCGFQLCELIDENKGEFAIYVSRRPRDRFFHGQFAHEVAHLLDANMYDVYIEGLNTLFAERVVTKYGYNWQSWSAHYSADHDPFYARTYNMIKQVAEQAGHQCLAHLLSFGENTPNTPRRRRVNVTEWLTSLCDEQSRQVSATLHEHWPGIAEVMPEDYSASIEPPQTNAA